MMTAEHIVMKGTASSKRQAYAEVIVRLLMRWASDPIKGMSVGLVDCHFVALYEGG